MSRQGAHPEITLRPAAPEDLPFLREMTYEAAFGGQNAAHEEAPPSFADAMQIPWVCEYFEGWGREGDFGLIAVGENDEPVGAAWYRRYAGADHVGPYELSVAVREEDRRKHVGETLLRELMEHANRSGIPELGLQVAERNEAARNLYEKLGFLMMGGKDVYDNYTMVAPTDESRMVVATDRPRIGGSRPGRPTRGNVRNYYDAFAPLHDGYAEAANWPAKADDLIGKAAALKRGGPIRSVLDLGAGTGMSIDAAMNHTEPHRVVAVDVSEGMLGQLLERQDGPLAVEPVVGRIENYLPAGEDRFDLITSLGALQFVDDLPEALKHVHHRLNPGGLLVATYVPQTEEGQKSVTTHSAYLRETLTSQVWPQADIEESLTSRGLVIVYREAAMPAFQLRGEWVYHNLLIAEKPSRWGDLPSREQ